MTTETTEQKTMRCLNCGRDMPTAKMLKGGPMFGFCVKSCSKDYTARFVAWEVDRRARKGPKMAYRRSPEQIAQGVAYDYACFHGWSQSQGRKRRFWDPDQPTGGLFFPYSIPNFLSESIGHIFDIEKHNSWDPNIYEHMIS